MIAQIVGSLDIACVSHHMNGVRDLITFRVPQIVRDDSVAGSNLADHGTGAEEEIIKMVQSNEKFDYRASAELFPGKSVRAKSRVVKYMRFDKAADAIRFAIEQLPTELLLGAYLEVDEKRYDSRGIRRLYDRRDYPLPRLAEVA